MIHIVPTKSKPEEDRFSKLSRAVLMFHRGGPWTMSMAEEWKNLTGYEFATIKTLCDFARKLRDEPGK